MASSIFTEKQSWLIVRRVDYMKEMYEESETLARLFGRVCGEFWYEKDW